MEQQSPLRVELVKPWYKRWWVWMIVVISITVLIGDSGETPNSPKLIESGNTAGTKETQNSAEIQKIESFKVKDKVQLGNYVLVVNEVTDCISTNQFMAPKEGNKFVIIDVTQENKGTDPLGYNLWNFKIQDDKDFTYQTAIAVCREPSFGGGDLAAGQKTRGYVTFEIPKGNSPKKIIFAPIWLSSKQVMIDI